MAKIIGLPKLSPTMEEGTLVRWVKQEGEAIEVDDLIAEVETDKATMEFRSFDRGVLLKQLAKEGATLQPDEPVAIVGNEGDDITELLKKAGGGGGSPDKAEAPKPKPTQDQPPTKGKVAGKKAAPAAKPSAKPEPEPAEESDGEPDGDEQAAGDEPATKPPRGGKGSQKPALEDEDASDDADETGEQPDEQDADAEQGSEDEDAPEASEDDAAADEETDDESGPSSPKGDGRIFASPVVRKIARENSIDLSGVEGSGPRGRVIKRDVAGPEARGGDSRVGLPGTPMRGPSAPPPAMKRPATIPQVKVTELPSGAAPAAGDRSEKLSQMRKTIARRLVESKREVPHFYLTIDIDAEPLVRLREDLNQRLAASGEKVSLNDVLIKAVAVALRRMPRVNVSFAGDSMVHHADVNISVAVAVPDGLVTPVIRRADQLGILEIAQRIRELSGRAKEKKLKPEEMQGGTFSISNLGMYGIDSFSAVINPPEGAILAVGAVREEPVVKSGLVVPGKRLALTMSCDHRVVDGALGAEWLRLLRGLLEAPLSMLL